MSAETSRPDWPASRWLLTAPESRALLRAPELPDLEAIKLALKEVVLRGGLRLDRVERPGRLGRGRVTTALRPGIGSPPAEPALRAVLDLVSGLEPRPLVLAGPGRAEVRGVLLEHVATAVRKRLGSYRDETLLPTLERRGLARAESAKTLGLLPRCRVALSEDGRAAQRELREWLEAGEKRFGGWARNDPERALAFAGGAGAAVLLMSEVHRELDALLLQREGAGAVGGVGGEAGWAGSSDDPARGESARVPDAGEAGDPFPFDLGAIDLTALGGLDAALGTIDAAVDASGGGGDGGGGGNGGGAG